MTFARVWIWYTAFGVSAFLVVLAWGVRERQFTDLDRGRRIPLSRVGESATHADGTKRPRIDRWGLAAVVATALSLLLAAVVLGLRSA